MTSYEINLTYLGLTRALLALGDPATNVNSSRLIAVVGLRSELSRHNYVKLKAPFGNW